jgi:hypothetical protein
MARLAAFTSKLRTSAQQQKQQQQQQQRDAEQEQQQAAAAAADEKAKQQQESKAAAEDSKAAAAAAADEAYDGKVNNAAAAAVTAATASLKVCICVFFHDKPHALSFLSQQLDNAFFSWLLFGSQNPLDYIAVALFNSPGTCVSVAHKHCPLLLRCRCCCFAFSIIFPIKLR